MGLVNNYQFELLDTLPTSSITVRISNEKENGAVATFTDQYITLRSDDNSIVERVKGTAAAGVLTLSKRGLDQSDVDNEVVGLKKEWREGTKAFVTYVASQHVDAKGNNTFSGNQTFTNITVTNNSTLTNATVSGKYKGPVVADITARDILYPSPVDGNECMVQSLNTIQFYSTSAGGWQSLGVSTPVPDSTELLKGKARIATDSEVTAGTDDTTIVTPLKLKKQLPEALYEKDQYIAGETILANDSLFVESLPTFAESTLVQNIGDVTGNTRVAILGIGSGVASNTLKLSLRKFVSPSADLSVRIETVSGGSPTGTLVNANATATVTAASLTTSLVDTTITLAGSITITKGQQVAIVLSQVGDVVNATNYYGVGYVARDTNTRGAKLWNGTTRVIPQGIIKTSSVALGTNSGQQTILVSYDITPLVRVRVFNMTAGFTLNGGGYVNQSFTGTNIILASGIKYTLTKNYVNGYITTIGTITGNDLSITVGSSYIVEALSIQTESIDMFPYISSSLFENKVLSKTNATFSYKLPTDYVIIATQGYSIGQSVTSKYYGLHNYPGLVNDTIYYIANTPGAISAVAGTNPYNIGKTNNATILKIDGKVLNRAITVSASPFSYTNTTGGPIQVSITGGTVNPIVINGVTTATATNHINILPAGATMTVTYTVLPIIVYSDL